MMLAYPISFSGLALSEIFRPSSLRDQKDALCPYAEQALACPASAVTGSLQLELDTLMLDSHQANWDGYGAEAVSAEAYHVAQSFIRSLPAGIPKPEISADPDGCVTFEWRSAPRKALLVSVHPSFRLDYAAMFGAARNHGTEPFFGEMPSSILEHIRRVFAT